MTKIDSYGTLFPLNGTLCKNCVYRMSRLISPINLSDFGLDADVIAEMNLDENEEVMVEQHTCLKLKQDMDYLVIDCNFYKDTSVSSIFVGNPYKS